MQETGVRNGAFGADKFGFKDLECGALESDDAALYEHALAAGEACCRAGGALAPTPAIHTGRSPKDKFTVRDATTEKTSGGTATTITPEQFDALLCRFPRARRGKKLFAQDLYGGADPNFRIKTRVFTELAWHSLFIRSLLIRPGCARACAIRARAHDRRPADFKADPKKHGVRSETVIAIDFARKIVLIGGSSYAGEMKKSVFTTLNYYLPAQGRDADALLGQCRPGRRRRDVLRPVRHRQDHALRRSEPHADRRRRARLGPGRHLQFRRRLLRQDASSCRRKPSPKSTPRRNRFGTVLENVVLDPDTRVPRLRRRLEDREHPLGLSARLHPECLARPAAPGSRRTSSCSRPTPSA